jgi:hypothetical protein
MKELFHHSEAKECKGAKETGLSFRPKGEIFLQIPRSSLGMTDFACYLASLASWRDQHKFPQFAKILK